MKNKKIFIIAGEASGDILGADLMHSIIKKDKDISFYGVGGEEMEKIKGFKSIFNIADIAVMGIIEVLKRIFTIRKRISETIKAIKKIHPDLIITIDSPGFNMQVVKKIKKTLPEIKTLHYVAPQVWAWKEERAKKVAKLYDYLLCFFKFEKKYFEKYGLKTFAIGHTAITNVKGDKERFLKTYHLKKSDVIITMLPGSRIQMAKRLLPIYSEVADNLYNQIPNLKIVIPTTENIDYYLTRETKNWKWEPIIIRGKENRYDAFVASKAALAISGTSVLELTITQTPTIVAYKVSPISYAIAIRLVHIKDVALPNIIAGKRIIPEFIQNKCTANNLTKAMFKCINDNDYRKQYVSELGKIVKGIKEENGGKSPSDKASEIVLNILK